MPALHDRRPAAPKSSGDGSLTGTQKTILLGLAVFVGPSLVKKFYDKPAGEKVSLDGFNIVTKYETPAIEKMDNTLRIEFCAS